MQRIAHTGAASVGGGVAYGVAEATDIAGSQPEMVNLMDAVWFQLGHIVITTGTVVALLVGAFSIASGYLTIRNYLNKRKNEDE